MRAAPCREAFSYHQILSPQYNAAKRDGRGKAAHTHTRARRQAGFRMAARTRDWPLVPRPSPCLGPSLSRIREGGFRPPLDDLQTPVSGSNSARRGSARHCSGLCAEQQIRPLVHPLTPSEEAWVFYTVHPENRIHETRQRFYYYVLLWLSRARAAGRCMSNPATQAMGAAGRYRGRAQRALRSQIPPPPTSLAVASRAEKGLFFGRRASKDSQSWLFFGASLSHSPPPGVEGASSCPARRLHARKDRFASDTTRGAQACARPAMDGIGLLLG